MAALALHDRDYHKGLVEVADGCFAYLQPDGGWGWSNAGLVVGGGEALLVDTLFDLPLTRDMLDTMAPLTGASPIRTLVNTHANGDHCYGNQLVEGAEIIAAERAAEEMADVPPAVLAAMVEADLGPDLSAFVREAFGPFDFRGITPTLPTRTFTGKLSVEGAGTTAQLIEVGPAHTGGDVIVHLPERRVVYAGDILFVHGTPIVWAGPYANWVAACDLLLGLDVDLYIPGHGPITDRRGPETVKAYLQYVLAESKKRFEVGMSVADASFDIDLGEFADLGDSERLPVNVDAAYRELDPAHHSLDRAGLFGLMAALRKRTRA
ncbi:MAG: MBL fold metallo-hydrolase [Acidimicrobiia bacterium]|nr:MBL fold metallo-hydrolase [Acidimicrobiia bacterium]